MQRKIMISLVLVFALTAQSTARDAKADLEKRKAQLEQEKALLLKEMQNYAGAFLGGGEKIVKGLQEFTINMVGGVNTATGVGFSTVEVTHQIIKAREAGQKGDINGYNSAVRSVIVEVLKEAITKIKYKDIGEFLDWAMKAYSGGDAGKATLENIKTRRNLEKGKDQTIKRLGEVNQELLSVNQQLTNLPRIPAATREQLKANNGKIQEEQKKVASELALNSPDRRELDEAIEWMAFLDSGDRSFKGIEDFKRLAQKHPEIDKNYQAAYQSPANASVSAENCYLVKLRDEAISNLGKELQKESIEFIRKSLRQGIENHKKARAHYIEEHNQKTGVHYQHQCLKK